MCFQDGPALSMDQQLCWAQELQILHAFCSLYPSFMHLTMLRDGIKFLLFTNIQKFKGSHAQLKLFMGFFLEYHLFCHGCFIHHIYLGASARID